MSSLLVSRLGFRFVRGHWGTRAYSQSRISVVMTGEGLSNTGRLQLCHCFKLDNPATTSQVTYKVQGIAQSGSN